MRRSILLLVLMAFSLRAQAGILNLNLLDPSLFGNVIPAQVANEAIKLIGSYSAHRPYSGATPVTRVNTLDLGIEVTMVTIGDGINSALQANSIPTTAIKSPGLPLAKISLRKGLGDKMDFGFSGLAYQGNSIFGGDLKFMLYSPEEGPSYAFRFAYTQASIPALYVTSCSTFNPELLMSQPLSFAESYLGIGARLMTGNMKVTVTQTIGPLTSSVDLTRNGSASSGYAFTGVGFRIFGAQGLRLGVEGSFDLSGYHTMGIIAGIGF